MTTIDCLQLLAILRYLHIDPEVYDTGYGIRPESCVAIEKAENGWCVFDADRAHRYREKIFDNETDACCYVLDRVLHMKGCRPKSAMNLRQLHSILVYLQVPEALYDFSGNMTKMGAYSIEWTEQGWEEYQIENGRKHSVAVFGSETDACYDLLYRVIHL